MKSSILLKRSPWTTIGNWMSHSIRSNHWILLLKPIPLRNGLFSTEMEYERGDKLIGRQWECKMDHEELCITRTQGRSSIGKPSWIQAKRWWRSVVWWVYKKSIRITTCLLIGINLKIGSRIVCIHLFQILLLMTTQIDQRQCWSRFI